MIDGQDSVSVAVRQAPGDPEVLLMWNEEVDRRGIRFSRWEDIPFTRKDDLRRRGLRHLAASGRVLRWLSSSGTTGVPTYYPWSVSDQQVADETVRTLHRRMPEPEPGNVLIVAPTGLPAVGHHMRRQAELLELSAVAPGAVPPSELLDLAFTFEVSVVVSLPSTMSRLAEFSLATRGCIPPSVRALHCGGDILSPARRARLEALWGVPVWNFYGLSELFGPFAADTAERDGLHFGTDRIFVEVLDPITATPVHPGEVGVAVFTSLWPKASPILRYWSEDLVRARPTPRAEGEVVLDVLGRPANSLDLHGRRVRLIEIDDVLLRDSGVNFEWFISDEEGRLTLHLESADGESPSRDTLERVEALLNATLSYEVHEPGSLPRNTPKFRFWDAEGR